MLKDRRMYTVFALMLAMFLTAVDVTIVDTAMPRIVGALGGFSMLTWLVTAYMLTSTATVPVYGKLADLFGRKLTLSAGAIIFVGGSALCGAAQSMEQLILFRAIQGLGAGAVVPVVQTIIGDIFTPAERAKVQGWFSGVWGFSALVGPLMGGVIVDYASWRWLFYINLPLGALALIMIWRTLDEKVERRKVDIDYLGSITLTLGISALILALLTGGAEYAWTSPQIVGLVGIGAALLVLFVWHERRAPDPMLPLSLFKTPAIGVPVLASFMVGGVMYGVSVYLPLWAQAVQGYSATESGASLLWLSIGWPLSAVVGGRFIMRMGVRPAVLLGMGLNLLGTVGLATASRLLPVLPGPLMAVLTFIIGWGMGFTTLAFVLGVQAIVERSQRGVATASLQFMRTLGGLVWVSVMGAIMNLGVLSRLRGVAGLTVTTMKEAGEVANKLLEPVSRAAMEPGQMGMLVGALANSLRSVHLVMVLAAGLSLLCALFLPNLRFNEQATSQPEQAAQAGGH